MRAPPRRRAAVGPSGRNAGSLGEIDRAAGELENCSGGSQNDSSLRTSSTLPIDEPPAGAPMAANLTPQYLEAEAECKKAHTAEERLACLKKMYALLPKHKASEKLQAELKTKISDAREACEKE